MKALYVDTSALVKLYIDEAGSEHMANKASAAELVASSVLAWPETLASLARSRREGRITAGVHTALRARFASDWADVSAIDLDGRVLEIVERLVDVHPLRGADAAHLASALVLREAGLDVEFACSDRTLLGAARSERLAAFDPAA